MALAHPSSRPPEEEQSQALRLTTTLTTASTPATGPSTPTAIRTLPLAQLKIEDQDEDEKEDIIPPARPSSTPFPQQEMSDGHIIQFSRHLNTDHANHTHPLQSQVYTIYQMARFMSMGKITAWDRSISRLFATSQSRSMNAFWIICLGCVCLHLRECRPLICHTPCETGIPS